MWLFDVNNIINECQTYIYIYIFLFDDISIYKYYVIKFVISLALFIFKLSALEECSR